MLESLRKIFGVPERPVAPTIDTRPRSDRTLVPHNIITTSVIGRTMVATIVERELSGACVFDLGHTIGDMYLATPGVRHLVLDMENVRYVDSAGLSALVDLIKVVKPRHGKIAIAAAAQQVEVLFKLTRLELVFTIRRSTLEAIDAVERTE